MSVNRFFYYEDDIYKDYRKQPDLSGCFFMGEGLRRSTVAHFARKVRGANIMAAKHGLKIQQSHVRYMFVALTLRAK